MALIDHLEKLRVFREVALSQSFSRAAHKLRLSQPSLSRAVKILEDDLRCALFVRSPLGVIPTAQGRALLDYADQLFLSTQAIQGTLHGVTPNIDSTVCLGTHESISVYFFPAFLKHLQLLHPNLQVRLKTGRSRATIELLKRGEVDAAITVNPPTSRIINSVTLFHDRFNFYISPSLTIRPTTPIILMSDALEMSGTPLRSTLERKMKRKITKLECENHETVRALTEEALGIGLLPDHVARTSQKNGLLRRYDKGGLPTNFAPHVMAVSVLRERERDTAVQRFFQEVIRFSESW